MKQVLPLCLMFGLTTGGVSFANDTPTPTGTKDGFVSESTIPGDCPFERSRDFLGILFTERHAEYENADTWYPSWASDNNQYSPWTDGKVQRLRSNSAGKNATTGHATIIGDDPLHLTITNHAVYPSDPAPYQSRYPCGSLVYNGVWYYRR